MKPLTLWQRTVEHHNITHLVDFAAGSTGLAIAAAGAVEYEGIAASDTRREWLDSTLDRVAIYLAGKKPEFVKGLGGDAEFLAKV